MQPGRAVRLEPWLFYLLPFGYELAQAAVVYVGGDVVERAFREKSDAALVAAIDDIEWGAFRAWLRKGGRGGNADAAIVVGETDLETLAEVVRLGVTPWHVLESLGAALPGGRAAMQRTADEALKAPDRVAQVLAMLLEPGGDAVVVAADLSAAMDRPLGGATVPAALGGPGPEWLTASPRDFAASLHRALAKRTEPAPWLVGMTVDPRLLEDLRTEEPFTLARLPQWIAKSGLTRVRLVCCLAQPDAPFPFRELHDLESPPAAVLVVDFAPDAPGQAWRLARALETVTGGRTLVAYLAP